MLWLWGEPMEETPSLELAEIAASTRPVCERAQGMLEGLRRVVPFDAAWLALADPMRRSYTSLAGKGLDKGTLQYLAGPQMAQDIEVTRTNRAGPPLSPSDLPYPASDLPTWAECLIPAGFHEALAVGLFDRAGCHIGFLTLLFRNRQPPPLDARRRLHELTPLLADGIDPIRSLAAAARVVQGATAGAVLYCDRPPRPLPGLDGDGLLADGSPVVAIARSCLESGRVFASFLWPLGGPHAPEGHIRVTVLAGTEMPATRTLGTVVLSPVTELRGLTPRELEVLGLLVAGYSNQRIADALVVAGRTVATHIEHILTKLGTTTRTHAAVQAERKGLYVPLRHSLELV